MHRSTVQSIECKEDRHLDCDGYKAKKEWLEHDQVCECKCHKPIYLRE
jgi:hypothetical protein